MKKSFQDVFKTIFFRGNYQFLPTVIYFWFCVLMFAYTYGWGVWNGPFFAALVASVLFSYIVFVLIANMIGILIYQWIKRAQTHK